jgi:GTP-binding protein
MVNPFAGARFLLSAAQLAQLPAPDRPEIAFAGRSNAGKSSALNALCGAPLARVSKTPGRTQLLNFFELPQARLVDLPGYGYADVPQRVRAGWGALVGGYVERRDGLRGLVLVMDARRPLTDFDRQLLGWLRAQYRPCHVLLTKSDKLAGGAARRTLAEVQRALPALADRSTVQLFSAKSGLGVAEARHVVAAWLESA